MSDVSTNLDLVELTRQGYEAARRGDLDAAMSLYAPDAVYETERFGRFEGRVAIRAYFEDWYGSFDEFVVELEEVIDLGNGVVFSAQLMKGRHTSSSADVGTRNASVHSFAHGLVVRSTIYVDVDEGRAAAERLAESRM
jgi:ketosteroid isomerase-like protein